MSNFKEMPNDSMGNKTDENQENIEQSDLNLEKVNILQNKSENKTISHADIAQRKEEDTKRIQEIEEQLGSPAGEMREQGQKMPDVLTEKEKAQQFWETRLQNEIRIETPQKAECEFSIVIPVHNEKPERVLKQIESLRNQQNIDPSAFELIYVVNNSLPDGGKKTQTAVAANNVVMEALKGISDLNIFVIDKSSTGNEIEDCNVGKARNRGIAEASIRFHENNKNGILIQSDADSYFEDPYYFKKIREISNQNPDAIGVAGGLMYEFSPDTNDPEAREILKQKLQQFTLRREWQFLSRFMRDPEEPLLFQKNTFSGAHMISKSFETAVLGGLGDTAIAEDVNFGEALKAHAAGRGQDVLGKREELFVITSLRESDRTPASFKKYFDIIDPEKQLMGRDPLTPTIIDFRQQILEKMQMNIHNPAGLREVMSDKNGNLFCNEEGFENLISYLKNHDILDITEPFFAEWRQKYFGESDPIQDMYDGLYPEIPITKEALKELEDQVLQDPRGKKFIENMRANLTGVRMEPAL